MSARRGVLIFVLMLAVLAAAVLFSAVTLRRPRAVAASTVLIFDVPEEIEEAPAPAVESPLGLVRPERPTLWDVVSGLRVAAADDHVQSLVLHIDDLNWGWGKIAEVREAILAFRRSGKPVYTSLEGGGEREYLLASAASRLSAPPLAVLRLDGLTASALFLRGTFEKLGVNPNFAHVGQYKSAVEGYTRTGMSPAHRAALEALLDDEYRLLLDTLGAARHLKPDSVARLLDEGPWAADGARARGLLDTVLYASDVDSLATRAGGHRRTTLAFNRYLERVSLSGSGPRVALVLASGTIAEGRSRSAPGGGEILGSETVTKALREARTRSSIRAIVLRIDSPGGSAQAADDIWHEVDRCRVRKPVIVSMSDYAASGGYYIAVAADSIVAEPGTITGSIGVFGGKLNVLGLYHKLGLNVETVSRGRHAEMLSPFRDFTAEESARFQAEMERVYDTFVSRVSKGRRLSPAAVDSVGQGRVWSGLAARSTRLVDALGGIERAFAMARAKAGIARDAELTVEVFPRIERTLLQRFLSAVLNDETSSGASLLGSVLLPPAVRAWLIAASFPAGAVLALMPYSIEMR